MPAKVSFQSPLTSPTGTSFTEESPIDVNDETVENVKKVTAWQSEMNSMEQKQMKIQTDQMSLMHSQIHILMRELGDLQKHVSLLTQKLEDNEEDMGQRVDDLASKMGTALDEAQAALRLEVAAHGDKAQEMETQLRQELQQVSDEQSRSNDAHHEKHAQNAQAIEQGLQSVLDSTHSKLEKDLQELQSGVTGSHGSLKDIVTDVTKQAENIAQSLEAEQQLRLAVEGKLDKMVTELRTDLEAALRESHAALKLDLAEHSGKAEDIKAAMDEAHAALRGEFEGHAKSSEERHKVTADTLNSMIGEHQDKHAANAEKMEASLQNALGSTHAKLQEELKLLKSGGAGSLSGLTKIVTDVTQQVDKLEQAVAQEQELRLNVEKHMDKMFNDQDKVVCELHRELKATMNEAHAALRLELADLGKNSDEMRVAMQDAHKALRSEHGKAADDYANKLDSHGQAHTLSLAELENRLRNDLKRSSTETETRHRDLKAMSAKQDANHSTLDQRIQLLEMSVSSKYEDSFKEIQNAHGKIQEMYSNIQGHKSKAELNHASTQERMETLERQLKEKNQSHDLLHGKFQGEILSREKATSGMDMRLAKLEALFGETSDRHTKEVEGAHGKVREALSKFEQTRTSLENHKSIMDQRLSYLDKALLEAQDSHSQSMAQALSNFHTDHGKEMTYALQAERAAREAQEKTFLDFIQDAREQREAFESTMHEQLRLERVAREVQWNQLKDSIKIKESMWQSSGNTEYADILQNEHNAREAVERSFECKVESVERAVEHKMDSVERGIQIERSERVQEVRRLWDALDSHTHDTAPVVREVRKVEPKVEPQRERSEPVVRNVAEPVREVRRERSPVRDRSPLRAEPVKRAESLTSGFHSPRIIMSPRNSIVHPTARVVSAYPAGQTVKGSIHVERHLVMPPQIIEPSPLSTKTLVTQVSGYQSPATPAQTTMTGKVWENGAFTPISRMASQNTITSMSGSMSTTALSKCSASN